MRAAIIHLWEVPVVERDHRLKPPLEQGVDNIVVMLHSLRIRLGSLALGVDATPRKRQSESLKSSSLCEIGVLSIPTGTGRQCGETVVVKMKPPRRSRMSSTEAIKQALLVAAASESGKFDGKKRRLSNPPPTA